MIFILYNSIKCFIKKFIIISIYNLSVKEGNKMITVNIKEIINSDINRVWETILNVSKYSIWRSDLDKIELINDKQFVEYTNNGYKTYFTVTDIDPYKRWEFDIQNRNMKGHWVGIFTLKSGKTLVSFTESITVNKIIMKPFVRLYLKKQQKQFIKDLKKILE